MSKNNKEQVKNNEAVGGNVVKPNIPEHSEEIKKLVEDMKVAVARFERGWSVKGIEPMKEQIKSILERNEENE